MQQKCSKDKQQKYNRTDRAASDQEHGCTRQRES